jgi:hypothetical protein
MDIIDQAGEFQERELAAALAAARQVTDSGPTPCGLCHNCTEPTTTPDAAFCDADCRDDWEHRRRMERRG